MELTNTQIAQLYTFTRQHYVEHYDVQTELVDHLAIDIEKILEENPSLSFSEARDNAFQKFGVFGFMDIVEQKQKQLSKKYIQLIFRFVLEWLKFPKIIASLFLFYLLYSLQFTPIAYNTYICIYLLLTLAHVITLFLLRRGLKRKNKRTGKKWMLEDIMQSQGIVCFSFLFFHALHTPPFFSFQVLG